METRLKKVIIAVVGSTETGKSSAINQLANTFPFIDKKIIFPDIKEENNDVVCFGKYQNNEGKELTLGICSFGDHKSYLKDYFLPLIEKYSCNVIVGACHNYRETDGNTFNYILNLARKHDYRLITTSILRDDANDTMNDEQKNNNKIIHFLNEIFAENMSNFIKSIV